MSTGKTLDKLQVIRLAGCHKCGARPGERCLFTRSEDPRNLRAAAAQSHLDRIQRARKFASDLDTITLDL